MKELTKKLCNAFGPSGEEDEVRALIKAEIAPYCDKIETDKVGNLIAFKRGKKKTEAPTLFAAHMDEVGLMIEYITDDGYLYFDTVGGIDRRVLAGRRVEIGEKRIRGAIASKAIHLQKPEERGICVPVSEMYIDIGAKSREEAAELITVGDNAVFVPNFEDFGDGFIKSKALDDRIGCAVLCEMIKSELEYDTYFAFTVCEEVGCRGALSVAFALSPARTVVIEATTAGDLPDTPQHRRACAVGEGAVLSYMDGGAIYDRAFFDKALAVAKEKEIPCQVKNIVAGGNDSQSFQTGAAGSRVLAISAPTRYIHSASSVVSVSDLEAVRDLAVEVSKMD